MQQNEDSKTINDLFWREPSLSTPFYCLPRTTNIFHQTVRTINHFSLYPVDDKQQEALLQTDLPEKLIRDSDQNVCQGIFEEIKIN